MAIGNIVWITGTVTNQLCQPVTGALVEIWQACESGKYNHPSDPNTADLDPDFQYWGKSVTDQNGNYKFRTIVPGAYQADENWIRPPHVHFKVSRKGYLELITQMYFAGEHYNSSDKILQRLSSSEQKDVIIYFQKELNSNLTTGRFNITIEKL